MEQSIHFTIKTALFIKIVIRTGSKLDPCGTPLVGGRNSDLATFTIHYWTDRVMSKPAAGKTFNTCIKNSNAMFLIV